MGCGLQFGMGAHSRHVRGSQKQGSRNKKKAAARDKRAADAAAAKQQAAAEAEDDVEEPEDDSDGEQPTRVHDEAQEERRRQAIVYKFEELGAPPEEQWSGPGGTLAEIRKWLGLHCDADVRPIKQVLQRHVAGESLRKPNSGRRQKLSHGEALVAADCMERGKGRAQAAYIVTARREEQGRSKVSEKAVRTAFRTLGGVTQRRGTDGTGSRDVESAWAQTSLAQAVPRSQRRRQGSAAAAKRTQPTVRRRRRAAVAWRAVARLHRGRAAVAS